MTNDEMRAVNKFRWVVFIVSTVLFLSGVMSLFHPAADPLKIRIVSALASFVVGTAWLLPGIRRVSLARCLHTLAMTNVLAVLGVSQMKSMAKETRWDSIYHRVAELVKTAPFDFDTFATFLSQHLRSGETFWFAIVFLLFLDAIALGILATQLKPSVTSQNP
jgi:hypothetical protein